MKRLWQSDFKGAAIARVCGTRVYDHFLKRKAFHVYLLLMFSKVFNHQTVSVAVSSHQQLGRRLRRQQQELGCSVLVPELLSEQAASLLVHRV